MFMELCRIFCLAVNSQCPTICGSPQCCACLSYPTLEASSALEFSSQRLRAASVCGSSTALEPRHGSGTHSCVLETEPPSDTASVFHKGWGGEEAMARKREGEVGTEGYRGQVFFSCLGEHFFFLDSLLIIVFQKKTRKWRP